ncbi:MAG: hypothetical protein MUD01_06455 [Chloroflexaceae bacterium]|nr:hypothetical protein [Chloroflexaceae bacterium]
MHQEYNDQDTERVRQAEHSSAGMPTQSLSGMYAPVAAAPHHNNNLAGMALVAVGLLGLASQMLPNRGAMTAGMVLLTIASIFLFFSFWKHVYGLLIPGAILASLSVGVPFASMTRGVSVLWGLALGFLAILVLGRSLFQERNPWPMYPAITLFGVGLIVAVANAPTFLLGGLVWLPLLLIGAGLYLGWGRRTA